LVLFHRVLVVLFSIFFVHKFSLVTVKADSILLLLIHRFLDHIERVEPLEILLEESQRRLHFCDVNFNIILFLFLKLGFHLFVDVQVNLRLSVVVVLR